MKHNGRSLQTQNSLGKKISRRKKQSSQQSTSLLEFNCLKSFRWIYVSTIAGSVNEFIWKHAVNSSCCQFMLRMVNLFAMKCSCISEHNIRVTNKTSRLSNFYSLSFQLTLLLVNNPRNYATCATCMTNDKWQRPKINLVDMENSQSANKNFNPCRREEKVRKKK